MSVAILSRSPPLQPNPVAADASHDDTLARVLGIWREALNLPGVRADDVFLDLGAYSLAAMAVLARVEAEFGHRPSLLSLLSSDSTPRRMSELLRERQLEIEPAAVALRPVSERRMGYPVPAPHRKMVLDCARRQTTRYSVMQAFAISGHFDLVACQNAIDRLIDRHGLLRTSFRLEGEEVTMHVADEARLTLAVQECSEDRAQSLVSSKALAAPFDMTLAPLWRVTVLSVSEQRSFLVSERHHAITDGVSEELWLDEFLAAYRGETLVEPELMFKDYAVWQAEHVGRSALEAAVEYWSRKLSGMRPTRIACDSPDPDAQPGYDEHVLELGAGERVTLDRFCAERRVTRFACVVAALFVAISEAASASEVTVAARFSKRNLARTERMLGCFIDKILIRCSVLEHDSFAALAERAHVTVVEAVDHMPVPYETLEQSLIERGAVAADPGDELFSIRLNYLPPVRKTLELPEYGLRLDALEAKKTSSKYPMAINVEDGEGWTKVAIFSDRRAFSAQTVSSLLARLSSVLQAGLSAPERPLFPRR